MNLKQLEYFIALAEELHFGRAAERLGMAQPPLSRQIKQIENDLGALLFVRGRSGIALTQAGERFYERGLSLLLEFDDIKREVRQIGQGADGRLRVGFVGSATYGILPSILKSFRATYPEVNLSLNPMNNALLQRALIRREIDIAIARPALNDREILSRNLVVEPFILAIPDTVDLPPGPVELGAMPDVNFILYPEYPRPSFADVVIEACQTLGVELKHRVFTMDIQTAIALVVVGEGVAMVPASVGTVQRNGVRFHQIARMQATTGISINHRIDEQSIHVKNFATLAQKVARKLK